MKSNHPCTLLAIPDQTPNQFDGIPVSSSQSVSSSAVPAILARPIESASLPYPVRGIVGPDQPVLRLRDVEEYLEDLGLSARHIDHRAVRFEHESGVFLFILDDSLPFFFTIQANNLVPDRLIEGVEMVRMEERRVLLSDLCHEFNASYKLVKFQLAEDSTVNVGIEGCANQVADMKPWFRFCLGLMKTAIKAFIGRYGSAIASVDLTGPGLSLH